MRNGIEEKGYELTRLRQVDMEQIRIWRNAQREILRQNTLISEEEQKGYFENYIMPTFSEKEPKQILFSFLHNGNCIGYGGLTNIDWISKRGEVSFLLDPEHVENKELYKEEFSIFLHLLSKLAFQDLKFHRLFTETFSFRDNHVKVLEDFGFIEEGILREHVFKKSKWFNSIIHGLLAKDWLHEKS